MTRARVSMLVAVHRFFSFVVPAGLLTAVLVPDAIAAAASRTRLPADAPPAAATPVVPAAGDFAVPEFDEDACMAELRRCGSCPAWDHYAIFDVLFLQRNNDAGDQPLAFDAGTGLPALSVQDIQASVAPGVRLFYGRLVTDRLGWEIGYTGIYGMFGDAAVAGDDSLTFPDPIGTNFEPGDQVRATWLSTLNIAEANLFCYDCREECGSRGRRSCHCSSWLVGFVWAGLEEQSSLTALCCDTLEPSTYAVRTTTNYFGPQLGQWGRREWCRWAVEGWWKAAVCGTSASQSQDPIISSLTGEVRPARSATDAGVGLLAGLNGTAIYRLTDIWGIRAGYNCYWLTSAALAPTQYDFGTLVDSGAGIDDNGGVFLHGANLGLEARW